MPISSGIEKGKSHGMKLLKMLTRRHQGKEEREKKCMVIFLTSNNFKPIILNLQELTIRSTIRQRQMRKLLKRS